MQFKNILKVASALFLVAPSLASFQRDCGDLNEELSQNVQSHLFDGEKLEDFAPIRECGVTKNGKIDELYLVSQRIDEEAVTKALSTETLRKLTYVVDDDHYQHEQAVYGEFPSVINGLPQLEYLTLKYNYRTFYKGEYAMVEKEIDPACLGAKNLKFLTLDHIEINDDIVDRITNIHTLQILNVISGDDEKGNSKHESTYKKLQLLTNYVPIITLDGKPVEKVKDTYQRDCDDLNSNLIKVVEDNLKEDERIEDFPPLRDCSVTKKGKIDELYLVSQRLSKEAVTKALSIKTLRKLTYLVDDDHYQREPAVYGKFPSDINSLPQLENLTLKYNYRTFYKGEYAMVEKEIDPACLGAKNLKILTLDHIEINDDIIEKINESNLEILNVISGDDEKGNSKHDVNYEKLQNAHVQTINLDGQILF